MDIEVRHLRLVAAVADCGSLTRAGDRLHLTQSALSHQLRDIESRLGAALFLRVGKRLVLTPAGDRLLASAREVLERLHQAEHDIRQMGRERAGVLRLTTECYTCYHWLPPLLTRYRRKFPRVDVRIDVDATRQPIETLLAGKVDIALMSTPVRDRRLTSTPIFDDEVIIIAATTHPFAKKTHVKVADMHGETLLLYPPKEDSLVLNEVLLPAGAVPARIDEVQLTEAIIELVKAGLGVSPIARWAVEPMIKSGALVARPLTARGLHRRWSAVIPKDLAKADFVREFINLLVEHAPGQSVRGPARVARTN
ncbi:MAG TPA: LysR substrate-binding domain-containing protein [Vicinamibacterales bacterium]|jgi:LysR family transcriptional regulator for metE and metH|nr:LysR substrate-binding domain-containing protein [Vicinamibacterales bacterium]